LAELLQRIVEFPTESAAFYEGLWNKQQGCASDPKNSITHYYQVRADFNRTQDAHLFHYLLARCVKGSVRYNAAGMFNQSPDTRRQGTQPKRMHARIFGVSALLKGKAEFSALDYRDVLRQAQANDLVYLDPPYQGVCGSRDARYFSGVDHDDFVAALTVLNARAIAYIVSYDGRCGEKTFGEPLPAALELTRVELVAGRSSQSTLLGRDELTTESLYLSRALTDKLAKAAGGSTANPAEGRDFKPELVF
jgi:DNA adenine methylase